MLLFITTGVDVLWLLFWVPRYQEKEMAKWNYGLHMFVVGVSILEIALKVIIFFILFLTKTKNSRNSNRAYLEQRYVNAGETNFLPAQQ